MAVDKSGGRVALVKGAFILAAWPRFPLRPRRPPAGRAPDGLYKAGELPKISGYKAARGIRDA